MSATTFDTYEQIKKLQEGGFTETQAVHVVNTIKGAHDTNLAFLATKADVQTLKAELKNEIAGVRTALKTEMAELKTELKTEMAGLRTALAETKSEVRGWLLTGFIAILGMLAAILLKLHYRGLRKD